METVEYLVVRVPANFVFIVDEAGVDVLSLDKFRQGGIFLLQHNGTQALQLAFLFSEDVHLVVVFHLGADVGEQ